MLKSCQAGGFGGIQGIRAAEGAAVFAPFLPRSSGANGGKSVAKGQSGRKPRAAAKGWMKSNDTTWLFSVAAIAMEKHNL